MPSGKKEIIITGGNGFIGANLARFLKARCNDITLTSIDLISQKKRENTTPFDNEVTSCFSSNDVTDIYREADAIIHLAATTSVQGSIQNPNSCFDNNVTRTQKLLETIRNQAPRTHLLFASTGGAIVGNYEGKIHENVAPRPMSPYGATKLAVEGMLSAYKGSFGMKTTALRFSNVYGPYSEQKSSVISQFCKAYVKEQKFQIYGDGLQTRDYIHVTDICEAIAQVLNKKVYGTFQLGTGIGTSILDIVRIFQSIDTGITTSLEYHSKLPGEVRDNVCDISNASSRLNFQPKIDLASGIKETLCWFQGR